MANRIKILYIDEEIPLTDEIRENFELRYDDIKVYTAHSYAKALKLLSSSDFDFDVILIDIIIPVSSIDKELNSDLGDAMNTGIYLKDEILDQLKKRPSKRNPKILFYTARTNLTEEDTNGTYGVISKPKLPKHIVEQVVSELPKYKDVS